MNLVELRHFLFAVGFSGLKDILKVFVGLLQIAFLRFQLSYLFSEEYSVDTLVRMIKFSATKDSASIWEETHECDMNILVDLLKFLKGLNCCCEL